MVRSGSPGRRSGWGWTGCRMESATDVERVEVVDQQQVSDHPVSGVVLRPLGLPGDLPVRGDLADRAVLAVPLDRLPFGTRQPRRPAWPTGRSTRRTRSGSGSGWRRSRCIRTPAGAELALLSLQYRRSDPPGRGSTRGACPLRSSREVLVRELRLRRIERVRRAAVSAGPSGERRRPVARSTRTRCAPNWDTRTVFRDGAQLQVFSRHMSALNPDAVGASQSQATTCRRGRRSGHAWSSRPELVEERVVRTSGDRLAEARDRPLDGPAPVQRLPGDVGSP